MKKLTVVFVTSVVIIVCVAILFLLTLRNSPVVINHVDLPKFEFKNTTDYNSVCRTESCVIATSKLHKRLNLDVNPCENFYDFACGTFVDETVIHDRNKKHSTLSIIADEIMEELRRLVTEKVLTDDIKPFVLVKDFYKKCIDRETIDNLGASPLMQIIDKLGGWPILEQNWNEGEFQWTRTTNSLFNLGFHNDYLVTLSMSVDFRNISKYILRVNQPLKNLSYNYFYYDFLKEGLANDKIKAYYAYMMELTQVLGASKNQSSTQMMEVLDFEIKMNKICASDEDLRNKTKSHHYTTINELQQKYPYMNWLSFVQARIPKHIGIDDSEEVLYMGTDFLEKFGELIENTPKRTVANYLFWRIADFSVDYLSKNIRLVKLRFEEKLSGTKSLDQVWKKCVTESVYNYKHAIGSMFIQRNLKENDQIGATKLVESIIAKNKQFTEKSRWIKKTESDAVLKMLNDIKMLIGLPPQYFDNQFIIGYHKDIIVSEDYGYYKTTLEMFLFSTMKEQSVLRENVEDTQWEDINNINEVNSKFFITNNFLTMSFAYLNPPFYSKNAANYLNYAGMGVDAAYLISHGVGNQLIALNSIEYQNQTRCFVIQYEKFMKNIHSLTISADTIRRELASGNKSFKVAYEAYKDSKEPNKNEPKLPGLDYTAEQLFWIAAAQIYCFKNRPEELIRRATGSDEVLEQFTVIGSLQNIPELSHDFNCLPGSGMNPVNKCEIF